MFNSCLLKFGICINPQSSEQRNEGAYWNQAFIMLTAQVKGCPETVQRRGGRSGGWKVQLHVRTILQMTGADQQTQRTTEAQWRLLSETMRWERLAVVLRSWWGIPATWLAWPSLCISSTLHSVSAVIVGTSSDAKAQAPSPPGILFTQHCSKSRGV